MSVSRVWKAIEQVNINMILDAYNELADATKGRLPDTTVAILLFRRLLPDEIAWATNNTC